MFFAEFQSDLCYNDGYCVYGIVASKTLHLGVTSTIITEKYDVWTVISIVYGHSRKSHPSIRFFLQLFAFYEINLSPV